MMEEILKQVDAAIMQMTDADARVWLEEFKNEIDDRIDALEPEEEEEETD